MALDDFLRILVIVSLYIFIDNRYFILIAEKLINTNKHQLPHCSVWPCFFTLVVHSKSKWVWSGNILRKTIEGYSDSFPSLTFNTIKTKLIMHAFHSSRYLQSKWMFDLSHASMIKVQYMSEWSNPLYWKVTSIQKWLKPIFIVCIS